MQYLFSRSTILHSWTVQCETQCLFVLIEVFCRQKCLTFLPRLGLCLHCLWRVVVQPVQARVSSNHGRRFTWINQAISSGISKDLHTYLCFLWGKRDYLRSSWRPWNERRRSMSSLHLFFSRFNLSSTSNTSMAFNSAWSCTRPRHNAYEKIGTGRFAHGNRLPPSETPDWVRHQDRSRLLPMPFTHQARPHRASEDNLCSTWIYPRIFQRLGKFTSSPSYCLQFQEGTSSRFPFFYGEHAKRCPPFDTSHFSDDSHPSTMDPFIWPLG